MDILLDFSLVEQKGIGEAKIDPKKQYENIYDDTTYVYYKSHRVKKTDPITFDILKSESSFRFHDMWDPNTGYRTINDPFGPLCFHPMNLLQHFYHSRLNGLWIEPNDGYEGYYGDVVGAGEDIILSRGIYPERYLFRLPVPNCYLKKGSNMSIITMGPKLTNREICEIDRLINKYWSNHILYDTIYTKIGSLYKLKCYYDVAISMDPVNMDLSGLELGNRDYILKQEDPNMCLNRTAIEVIKNMF
jgi:hypothetical protein